MKIVVVVGNTEEAKGLSDRITKGLGYDRYNTDEALVSSLESDTLTVGGIEVNTNLSEEILLNAIFERALEGRWGMVIAGTLTHKLSLMLQALNAVFVNPSTDKSTSENKMIEEVLEIEPIYYTGEPYTEFIRTHFLDIPEVFKGLHKKSTVEVIKEYKSIVATLIEIGINITKEWRN